MVRFVALPITKSHRSFLKWFALSSLPRCRLVSVKFVKRLLHTHISAWLLTYPLSYPLTMQMFLVRLVPKLLVLSCSFVSFSRVAASGLCSEVVRVSSFVDLFAWSTEWLVLLVLVLLVSLLIICRAVCVFLACFGPAFVCVFVCCLGAFFC